MTPDPEALEALAKSAEEATGPDRELDCRIWATLTGGSFDTYRLVVPDLSKWLTPAYTASLDAAMSLVPEGCLFTVRTLWDGPIAWGYAYVMIYAGSNESSDGKRYVDERRAVAQTPALTLTAAALRARAALARKGEA